MVNAPFADLGKPQAAHCDLQARSEQVSTRTKVWEWLQAADLACDEESHQLSTAVLNGMLQACPTKRALQQDQPPSGKESDQQAPCSTTGNDLLSSTMVMAGDTRPLPAPHAHGKRHRVRENIKLWVTLAGEPPEGPLRHRFTPKNPYDVIPCSREPRHFWEERCRRHATALATPCSSARAPCDLVLPHCLPSCSIGDGSSAPAF